MNLADGINALELDLPAGAEEKLAAYLALLVKWNKVYNLTAIRDPAEMVTHHLLDSLAVIQAIQKSSTLSLNPRLRAPRSAMQCRPATRAGSMLPETPARPEMGEGSCPPPLSSCGRAVGREGLAGCNAPHGVRRQANEAFTLADVGSGAGLPGLVLALARPDWSITCIETVDKKAAFQRQAKIELGLSNVSIHCGRVEYLKGTFSAVISRAFASLGDFVRLAGHLSPCLWAMKGGYPADEITALPAGWRVSASHPLKVPGMNAERHLLQLEKT
ncbi:MAG: 16S rRNA (guanine(527)-N(7))-methyltransferase RsmG [Rhodocyclaceae bacterium]|nr:16S rRNA (guanine(527)-N(7))-methyltransferase RsmG [Rhodocyclaceae bacterium]